MSERVTVAVTPDHILHGLRRTCTKCPIALAVNEVLRTDRAQVAPDAVHIISPRYERTRYKLPVEAQQFIQNFDNSRAVQPFEFEMKEIV